MKQEIDILKVMKLILEKVELGADETYANGYAAAVRDLSTILQKEEIKY